MTNITQIGPGPTGRVARHCTVVGDVFGEDARRDSWEVSASQTDADTQADLVGRCNTEADARVLVYGSPYGGLPDEEAGRRWCAASEVGVSVVLPGSRHGYIFLIWPERDLGPLTRSDFRLLGTFDTEAAAYAVVGRALRELAEVLVGRPERRVP